jgi:hypothetical protein
MRNVCTAIAQSLTHEQPMNLVPVRPPGPSSRKARGFAGEILHLRAQGYTFEAIREALAGAGVHVSNSTVQREVARAARRPPAIPRANAVPGDRIAPSHTERDADPVTSAPAPHACNEGSSTFTSDPSGKESAEAFFNAHHSNPLLSTKETP